MCKKHHKILAIDPGTREMGIALLEDRRIIYHAVKVIPKKRTPHETLSEGRKTVLRLINDWQPDTLAIEKTFIRNSRNAALLNVLADEIRAIGKRKGLEVLGFAPNTVKKFVCGNGHASKEEVARAIIATYPDLKVYLTQNRAWKAKFHQNMFDALAVGLTATSRHRVQG
jgi:crossover junction endodeoxyribonuclease RuvC